jgi:GntR family transcriptional regulator, vanillate catabolism transcriptional regulator
MTTITFEPRPGADPQDRETETLTGEATRRIRQSILDGELEPNARLNEVHLCDSLSISRTPLRAALQTLAGEGLLIYTANRGFSVRAFELTEIIDTFEMRVVAEGLAARLAAERGLSNAARERMEASLVRGDRLIAPDFPVERRQDEYSAVNEMFHGTIHRASGTQVVADVLARCQIPRVSARNIMVLSLDEMIARNQFHHDIFDAILCRESRKAEELMQRHVAEVKKAMVVTLSHRHVSPGERS